MTAEQATPAKGEPDFIELIPGVMTSGSIECTIEWVGGGGSTVRMHLKGLGLSDLVSLAGVLPAFAAASAE